jgi:hypothetical protein
MQQWVHVSRLPSCSVHESKKMSIYSCEHNYVRIFAHDLGVPLAAITVVIRTWATCGTTKHSQPTCDITWPHPKQRNTPITTNHLSLETHILLEKRDYEAITMTWVWRRTVGLQIKRSKNDQTSDLRSHNVHIQGNSRRFLCRVRVTAEDNIHNLYST